MSLAGPGGRRAHLQHVRDGNYFTALGVRPAAGRLFGAGDSERPGGSADRGAESWLLDAAVQWRSRRSWGRRCQLTGRPYTVVGVAPEASRARAWSSADLWLPVSMRSAGPEAGPSTFLVSGRLKPGCLGAAGRGGSGRDRPAAERREVGRERDPGLPRTIRSAGFGQSRHRQFPGASASRSAAFLAFLMGLVSLVLAHRVRERRRRPAGARDRAAARDCGAPGDRRRTRPARPAAAHGDAAAVRARRRGRRGRSRA